MVTGSPLLQPISAPRSRTPRSCSTTAGASPEQAQEHLERWALQSPARAGKAVEFLTDPLWRAYISTYVEGERLLSRWLDEGGEFVRLLDEQLTPRALAAEVA